MQLSFSIFMHMVGCVWHAIGSSEVEERTWIMDFEEREQREFNSLSERYLVSLHWAYAQMTPTSLSVQPQNTLERLMSCMICAVSILVTAFFVSRTTVAIGKLNDLTAVTHSRFEKLRRYMTQHEI